MIIRNLIFDINEKHLRKLFRKYGNIVDVNIPVDPATNRSKGYAFVELEKKSQALKAIKVRKDRSHSPRDMAGVYPNRA